LEHTEVLKEVWQTISPARTRTHGVTGAEKAPADLALELEEQMAAESLAEIAAEYDATLASPLPAPDLLEAALQQEGDRKELRDLFGVSLPDSGLAYRWRRWLWSILL
jgi:hypothetical protein